MFEPLDPIKVLARAAAGVLSDLDERSLRTVVEFFGRHAEVRDADGRGPARKSWADEAEWVGIWEPRPDGTFRRSEKYRAEWSVWADVETIGPKTTRKRVVLIGESVARAFGYRRGSVVPARILDECLSKIEPPAGVEVIDLARVGLDGRELPSLVLQSLRLQPDLIVILAGNNFHLPLWTVPSHERAALAEVLREHGVAALKRRIEDRFGALLQRGLAQIRELAEMIPVAWVVPEFNLADWRYEAAFEPPWLPGRASVEWWECLRTALESLSRGDHDVAAVAGARMVELDGGTSPRGYWICAQCEARAGRLEEARALLEKARDARTWDDFEHTPRALEIVTQAIRSALDGSKAVLVDTPALFRQWSRSPLPASELFLDYCHLSYQGLLLTMAAVASAVAPVLGGQPRAVMDICDCARGAPSNDVEAEALLFAAYLDALCGQPSEHVGRLCERALTAAPEMASDAFRILERLTQRCPPWALHRTAEPVAPTLEALFFRDSQLWSEIRSQLPDFGSFPGTLADALERRGLDARRRYEQLAREQFGVRADRWTDLLDGYNPLYYAGRTWAWRRHKYYSAYTPISTFVFVAEKPEALTIRIALRRPRGEPAGRCDIEINARPVCQAECGDAWQTLELDIPSASVVPGINELRLRWPVELRPGEEGLRLAADAFEANLPDALVPTYGEVHMLLVRARGAIPIRLERDHSER